MFGCKVGQGVPIGLKLDLWRHLLDAYTKFQSDILKHVKKKARNTPGHQCAKFEGFIFLIDWYFISKKFAYIYINSTYKQIKSSMCIQRYMYHLVAARETTASLSKLAVFRLNSTWLGHELSI